MPSGRRLDWNEIRNKYEAGESIGDIAKALDCDPTSVWNALKRMHIARRPRRKERNIPAQVFLEAVKDANSIYGVVRALGMSSGKHSYRWVKEMLAEHQPDTSHWTRSTKKTAQPLEFYLVKNSSYTGSSSGLRRRLLKEGYLENRCTNCGITDWQDKPLTVQLDHINGDRHDHRLENLRMLCPNCHSQTNTFSGRNRSSS